MWCLSRRALKSLLVSSVLTAVVLTLSLPARADRVTVNMRQARVHSDRVVAPTNRGDAVLTLDPQLQQDVMALVRGARAPEAAAIVVDVRTGRVLAWASDDDLGRDLVAVPVAPPASLFKVVTAAALIERAKVPPSARQCYVGGMRSARLSNLRAHGGPGVACSDFATALGYSRNMVMAGLAVRHLEESHLRDMARQLGVVGTVPIDVQVPAGSVHFGGNDEHLARLAAGFAGGRLSPLGAVYMMTILANDGERPALHLIDHLLGPRDQKLAAPQVTVHDQRALPARTANTLTRMLEVTVREGTAARAFRDSSGRRYLGRHGGVGKTGTLSHGKRLYTWYAGFAPADRPEVAVAVMLGNGDRWWRKANQVARDVLRAYFARQQVAGITHPLRSRMASKSAKRQVSR